MTKINKFLYLENSLLYDRVWKSILTIITKPLIEFDEKKYDSYFDKNGREAVIDSSYIYNKFDILF